MPVLSVLCHFFFCLMFSCQTYVLISLRRIIVVTQDLTFTSLLSFLLPLLSQLFCSVSWIFLAAAPPSLLLCSAFTPWFCSLRQESATDWGGCFKSIIARSEAIHLWYLSLSPSSFPLTLFCQWESGWLRLSVPTGEQVLYYLYAAAFNTDTQYASKVAYLCLFQFCQYGW